METVETGRVVLVDSMEDLRDALENAQAGDVIELAPGEYPDLTISVPYGDPWGAFDGEVTIRSADPENPAELSGATLRGVTNLTFENLVFDSEGVHQDLSLDDRNFVTVGVRDAENISFDNVTFKGGTIDDAESLGDGLPAGFGLEVRSSVGVTLTDSDFSQLGRAAVFSTSDDVTVTGNEVSNIRSDGFDFVDIDNVLIEGNYFHDFVTAEGLSADHRDMIQFWTTNTTSPSENIVIRGNIFDAGEGVDTQSIFMRNELVDSGQAGYELYYKNIVIEENVIYNSHLHGIHVGESDGLTIQNNTLLYHPDSAFSSGGFPPRISVAEDSLNVTITQNITHGLQDVPEGAENWLIDGNLVVQSDDPNQPNYVGDLFVDPLAGTVADLTSLQALPGSIVETGGYGASATRFDATPDELTAAIKQSDGNDAYSVTLDASYTAGPLGEVDGGDARFIWDFGNGDTAEGLVVSYSYPEPGDYTITLTVIGEDGSRDTARTSFGVPEPVRTAIDVTADGLTDLVAADGTVSLITEVNVVEDEGRHALELKAGENVGFARDFAPIYDLQSFAISLDFKATEGEASNGLIFKLFNSLGLSVAEDGSLTFSFRNEFGETFEAVGAASDALDGEWHEVDVFYDGVANQLSVLLDDQVVASTEAWGATRPHEYWGLNLGGLFSRKGFVGLIDDIRISSDPEVVELADLIEGTGDAVEDTVNKVGGVLDDVLGAVGDVAGEAIELTEAMRAVIDVTADGLVDLSLHGANDLPTDVTVAQEGGRHAIRLDDGDSVAFARRFAPIFDLPSFAISVDFKATDGEASAGSIWQIYNSLSLRVTEDGSFVFTFRNADGDIVEAVSEATVALDGSWHEVDVVYDGETNQLSVVLDDQEIASVEAWGLTRPHEYWGLTLGQLFGRDGFTGLIDDIRISSDPETFDIADLTDGSAGSEDPVEGEAVAEDPIETVELTDAIRAVVDVTSAGLVDLSLHALEDPAAGLPADVTVVEDEGRQALSLADGQHVAFDRRFAPIFDLPSFAISLDFKAAEGEESAGRLLSIYRSLGLTVGEDGALSFFFTNTDGETFEAVSTATDALDGGWHGVDIVYDGAAGTLSIVLDDQVVASVEAQGVTQSVLYWGLTLGQLFGREGFTGLIDDIRISSEPETFDIGQLALPGDDTTLISDPSSAPEIPFEDEIEVTESFSLEDLSADDITVIDWSGGMLPEGVRLAADATVDGLDHVSLDGTDDHIRVTSSALPELTDQLSVAFDIRFDEQVEDGGTLRFAWKHNSFGIQLRDDQLSLVVWDQESGKATRLDVPSNDLTQSLSDGDWHRVAVTLDAERDVVQFLIDGALAFEHDETEFALTAPERDLLLGGFGATEQLDGAIDSLIFADQVLSDEMLAASSENWWT